ncbi:MAG: DUF420 domain-containing protein [Bacteriovoracaceae bacterium]|jgi:putative membrane protein|nr:DUF420 domain-containing protein [Bacteriovoracaceae bacterium]
MTINDLPCLNAGLNSLSFILLLAGYCAIRKNQKSLHIKLMLSATAVSAAFLTSYLIYHAHAGSKAFPDLGWIKTIYLIILVPHIILAAVMVPMILVTFYHAFKQNHDSHKKWAKLTLPIWLFVSITGVIIYLMLYVFFTQ